MTDYVSISNRAQALGCVGLIPTYNNEGTLGQVVEQVKRYLPSVVVVNDGSTDRTGEILAGISGIDVISYPDNRGKGHALITGLQKAVADGFRYAITIDSDGQHFPDDIVSFLDEIERSPDSLIIGARNLAQENMPSKNSFANRFSNFWFKVETGKKMDDTQSGFRLYPLAYIKNMRFITSGYEFEVESAVRLAWKGCAVTNIPIKVYYAPQGERVSHFRPARDFLRISLLNTVLTLLALLVYYPFRFLKWLTWSNIKTFIKDNITSSPESNAKIAAAIGWGIMWGIIPAWGCQMVLAGVTAHFVKLNKVIAVLSSNISIPPMIPFIIYGSYVTGGLMLSRPVNITFHNITLESMSEVMLQYIVGAMGLAIVAGVTIGLLSWFLLIIFRKQRGHE